MVFELFRRGDSQLDVFEQQIGEMLATTHETLVMARDALFREVDPNEIGRPLRKADKSVNKVERAIRRALVVHASVHGSEADTPLMLTYMSIAKDIERVGDITKDLWDLAVAGVDLRTFERSGQMQDHLELLAGLILETARVFAERDTEAATRFLNDTDELKGRYEELMLAEITSSASSHEAVATALLYRYVNRITAHLMNVMTAVVMPVDRLDYWDEDKMDRD